MIRAAEEKRAVEALTSGRVLVMRLDVLFFYIYFRVDIANDRRLS